VRNRLRLEQAQRAQRTAGRTVRARRVALWRSTKVSVTCGSLNPRTDHQLEDPAPLTDHITLTAQLGETVMPIQATQLDQISFGYTVLAGSF
jgi:hypothetical protein